MCRKIRRVSISEVCRLFWCSSNRVLIILTSLISSQWNRCINEYRLSQWWFWRWRPRSESLVRWTSRSWNCWVKEVSVSVFIIQFSYFPITVTGIEVNRNDVGILWDRKGLMPHSCTKSTSTSNFIVRFDESHRRMLIFQNSNSFYRLNHVFFTRERLFVTNW